MSFDLPLTAFALESSGTQPTLGAVHTLTVPMAAADDMHAPGPCADRDAPPLLRTCVLGGEPPPRITITF